MKLGPDVADSLRRLADLDPSIEEDFAQALDLLRRSKPLPEPFGDHPMVGELRGWRAFEIGTGGRVVYFASRAAVTIVSAGPHDDAYDRAQLKRIAAAGRIRRARAKRRRRSS